MALTLPGKAREKPAIVASVSLSSINGYTSTLFSKVARVQALYLRHLYPYVYLNSIQMERFDRRFGFATAGALRLIG